MDLKVRPRFGVTAGYFGRLDGSPTDNGLWVVVRCLPHLFPPRYMTTIFCFVLFFGIP